MNFLDKIKLKVGVHARNDFDLSSEHITTSDFFRISPVYSLHTVPGGKYNIKAGTFTRLSPMVNPVLGNCTINNRAFFVPFEIIMHCWDAFITDTPYSDAYTQNTIPSKVTTFKGSEVARCFLDVAYSTTTGATSSLYDFIDNSTNSTSYRLFTPLGRRCWSILQSLGYKVPLSGASACLQPNLPSNSPFWSYDIEYNALKLLAFFKIFKDWYANQAYNQMQYEEVFYRVNGSLNYQDLDIIFGIVNFALYDKDYFTAAFDSPVNPNAGVSSNYSIWDSANDRTGNTGNYESVLSSKGSATATYPTTPVINGTNTKNVSPTTAAPESLSQFMIDQLKALTDYLKRNQIVGSKAADRMLARYGIMPSHAELHLSIPVGSDVVPIQISDVMATGTGSVTVGQRTDVSLLGDYAGKGIGFGSGGFSYESDDYGILMVISTIIPKTGYVQGSDRFNTSYLNRLDFFTPEFDGKSGNQAIRLDELCSPFAHTWSSNQKPDEIFGWIPRWADMKVGSQNLTGDFLYLSRNAGLGTWHMFRMFDETGNFPKHSQNFTIGEQSQYDRIFAYTGTDYDHFIITYQFHVKASLPMTKLFDSYEFDGGTEISAEVNGKQYN